MGALVSREEVVNIAVNLLVPIVTAVLGILGVAFGDWRQRRTQAGQRKLALEDASKQVSFVTEWWNARKLLADSPEALQEATRRAVVWLEEASVRVAESKPPPVDEKPPITLRRLLLLYPLQSRAATVIRGASYICLAFLPSMAATNIHDALNPAAATKVAYQDAMWILVMAALALSLRFLAGRVDKLRPEVGRQRRVSLRRALLFYRFHRPAARIVRIILYIWALFSVVWAVGVLEVDLDQHYWFAGDTVQFVAFIGYAVALRYWAASLEATRESGEASRVASSATTVGESWGE